MTFFKIKVKRYDIFNFKSINTIDAFKKEHNAILKASIMLMFLKVKVSTVLTFLKANVLVLWIFFIYFQNFLTSSLFLKKFLTWMLEW